MATTNYLAHVVRSTLAIARDELALFRRFPRLGLAALAICLVPALYALIYLSSVWDPNDKTNDLPVALVNLDQGFSYQGRLTNVGADLTSELIKTEKFGFRTMDDEQQARQGVRAGRLAFAVVIPRDFSAGAVPGVRAGGGKVTVVFSEGNNYTSAGFARRFAVDLGHQVNEALNEKRWEQVLVSVDGSGKSLNRLRAGVAQLRSGAGALNDGVVRYSNASAQLATAFKQVGSGIRGVEAKLPSEAELKTFRTGTQRLASRQRELGTGLEQLQAGARRLTDGAGQMRDESAAIPFVGERIAAGAGVIVAGGSELTEGLSSALDANARLARGAERVDAGAEKLLGGVSALAEGLRTMTDKLPEDNRLDAFAASGKTLVAAVGKMRAGVALVDEVLPVSPKKFDASARGLADSVEPALEVLAPVANNGSAFAPNMVAMASWLGAVMAVYLFNMRLVLSRHDRVPGVAKTLGKFAVPALLVLLQTALTLLMLVFGLGVVVPNYPSFALCMVSAALAFLAMAFLLVRAFGEAGKLFAVLLLTLQLAAGGGVLPIELSGDFFQSVHDWLPFTWVIISLRASLFGAFDGDWRHAWQVVVGSGAASLLLATLVGRWKRVELADYKPGIET